MKTTSETVLPPDQFANIKAAIRETGAGYEAGDVHDALHEAACDAVEESLEGMGIDYNDLSADQRDELEVAFKDGFGTDATEATGLLHSVMEWYANSTDTDRDMPVDLHDKIRTFLIGYTPPNR